MKANHDVTDALQRTIGLMHKELERVFTATGYSTELYRIIGGTCLTNTSQSLRTFSIVADFQQVLVARPSSHPH
jgi:hypothetical protein